MSATNGLTYSLRSRGRLIGCCLAVVFALSALFATTAGAAAPVKETYLALGDSLAFGYSQQLFNQNQPKAEAPTGFEHGYANYYLAKHKPKENGIQLVNVGCPGETSDGLIGNGPVAAGLEFFAGAHGEAPCAYHRLAGLPLHHEYGGSKSQLESALEAVAVNAAKGTPVTTITFNIGANDQLHQIAACEKQAGEEVKSKIEKGELAFEPILDKTTGEELAKACLLGHVSGLFTHIITNAGAAIFALREGSKFGGVNYLGKIVVQGGYDPYGRVYKAGEEIVNSGGKISTGGELLPLSNSLAASLNFNEPVQLAKLGICYADPQPVFNPTTVLPNSKQEPYRLKTLTNMANATTFEFPTGVTKFNGPDIHPTPAGYSKLASIMFTACG
jgi:lysophospholipase L1-like esterase